MTRALGDFYAAQFGLTHEPSVEIKKLDSSWRGNFSIMVASDGIWDCWRYEDFADFVNALISKVWGDSPFFLSSFHPCLIFLSSFLSSFFFQQEKSVSENVELLLNESISRAILNFGAKHYDDAACVCVALANQGNSSSSSSSSSSMK
jgi:serine/threonine protein phosphatase PrpC